MNKGFLSAPFLISLVLISLTTASCSQKPSDSDVGRIAEADGFAVKSFMIAKCTDLTPEIQDALKTLMRRHRLKQRETTSTLRQRTVTYYSPDDARMIRIYWRGDRVYKVYLEGMPAFVQPMEDAFPAQFTVRTLYNAKKVFTGDPIGVKAIVDRYAKEFDMSHDLSISGGESKRETAKSNEKRIVTDGTYEFIEVIVEGEADFVAGLRDKLREHD